MSMALPSRRVLLLRPPPANLLSDGDFEGAAPVGWATGGTNTIAVSTEQAYTGQQSLKFTFGNSATWATNNITLFPGTFRGSLWVYIPTAWDGSAPRLAFVNFTGASGTIAANANLAIRDAWQPIAVGPVTLADDVAGAFLLTGAGAAPSVGGVLYLDGARLIALS